MEEFVQKVEVPGFTRCKCSNGEAREGMRIHNPESMLFFIHIYPNGDEAENEGYVSIAFEKIVLIPIITNSFPHATSFHCIVSIEDVNGESRFLQSFGEDYKNILNPNLMNLYVPMKLERFIKRSALLASPDELLPNDTLTLRCDFVFLDKSFQNTTDELFECRRLHKMISESWFNFTEKSNDGFWLLNLRNPDSPLCTRLRDTSEFFEALFRCPCEEMENGYMRIRHSELITFFGMLWYIRFENIQQCSVNKQLYEMVTMYRVTELQEICSARLKQQMSSDCAIDVLVIADLNNDSELRGIAFRCILSNWNGEIKRKVSEELCPELRNQLLCAAQILYLEDDASDRLCYLAAKVVHLNRKIVQNSPTWLNFASKLPDLAHVILSLDSDGYTLDLKDRRKRGEAIVLRFLPINS